jgi:hypothetical protein
MCQLQLYAPVPQLTVCAMMAVVCCFLVHAGVAREVFQGKALSHTVTGLKPAAEYVFCVKATYDDGSFVWSESKAFTTKS